MRIASEVHACARLLGGPSDGFFGQTIGLTIGRFKARVTFDESAYLRVLPHPQYDPTEFQNLADLAAVYGEQGDSGGLRLLQFTLKHFYETCVAQGLPLAGPNFTASYDLDMQLGCGFAENSALVVATLHNMRRWFGLEARFPREELPTLAFETEAEEGRRRLSLQDCVVQSYGGALHMSFAQELLEARGYGRYTRIPTERFPPLFVAYLAGPTPADAVRGDVQQRWNEGDPVVRHAVHTLAALAEEGLAALNAGDFGAIGRLLPQDRQAQRQLYGDPVLGPELLRMLDIADNHDLPATISGTGVIIGVLGDEPQNAAFADHLKAEGFHYLRVAIGPEYVWE